MPHLQRPTSELDLRELLRELVHPDDVARLTAPGVRLGDLARPGFVAAAALLELRPSSRRRLEAAFELARRRAREEVLPRLRIATPLEAFCILDVHLGDEIVEVFEVILLDARGRMQGLAEISRGTLSTSLVHPREVFRPALIGAAAAVIVGHNHPSGDPTPSAEDDAVTRRLVQAGELLGIPLHDHLIIGDGKFVSYRDSRPGLLAPIRSSNGG